VFYYLIPEQEKEEEQVNQMKFEVHKSQASVMMKMKRFDDAIK
jgi:hypothetical protein